MAELSDAVLGLIIAAIVSILTLTIKNLHGSKCWSKEACCSCAPDVPVAVPVASVIVSTEI
tara:strand:+ start:678 stop:860 length:183 start_codon:yes stop_codon:yes gene_type:complete